MLNRWWLRMTLILLLLIHFSYVALGQTKQWDKTIGGSDDDNLSVIVATVDGGYLLGGSSASGISGDKTEESKGVNDYWVVKQNADGTKVWDKTFGGSDNDNLSAIVATADGGYLLGGSSASGISGDKTEKNQEVLYHSDDYWIVKLNADGSKAWDKTIGGNGGDELASLQQTSDGGYILGGFSSSDKSGDKTENAKGQGDYWVVKLNADGTKIWDKTIGGNSNDQLSALQQTSDGGYIIGGFSDSNKGEDKTEDSKGADDYWIVKLDANGTKSWDKTLGASGWDNLLSLQQTSDGGYILGGYSNSDKDGDKTENSKGLYDYWVVKLNADGTKTWDRTIGGNYNDSFRTLQQTSDGGYLLGGTSGSGISGDKTEPSKGQYGLDYWVVKLDPNGTKAWDRTIGGNGNDILQSLRQAPDGGSIVGGNSDSGIGGDKTEDFKGGGEDGSDYWVVKLNNDDNPCNQEVSSFTLLNADTEEELMALQQGDTINLDALPTQNLKIRSNATPATVGRVFFSLDSTVITEDNAFPYTFSSKVKFANGPHTLKAIPYCKVEDGGGKGAALTINFQVKSNERIVRIIADKDNTINSNSPEGNDGASVVFRTGRTGESGGNRLQRALLHFDLSSIPPGSRIDSAILTLHVLRTGGAATGVALHKVTSEWNELASTWSHAIFPGTPWTTPGGDFEPTATASTGDVPSSRSIVISNLTGDIQSWVNDSSSNFGWVLKVTDEEITHSAKLIASREQPSEIYRPSLHIVYTLKDDNPNPCNQAVSSFTLVNADTQEELMALQQGDTLDLTALPTRNLHIRANTTPAQVGSVVFALDSTTVAVESITPYTFSSKGKLAAGPHTLTATPYCEARGGGGKGTALTINFQVVNLAVRSFTLVNASNEQDLMALSDGDTLNLATLPTRALNVRANTSQQNGIDVVFAVSGPSSYTRKELGYPYALFSGKGGDYYTCSCTPPPGRYTLTATPYTDAGVKGKPLTISVTIVNPVAATLAGNMRAAGETQPAAILYPNPTSEGKIKVVLPRQVQGELTYTLVSLLGAEMAGGELSLSKPTTEVEFDFSRQMQATGVYFLHLKGQSLQTVLRVVRQ